MPTSVISMLAMLFLGFGVILVVDGEPLAGVTLILLSPPLFVLWWRTYNKRYGDRRRR